MLAKLPLICSSLIEFRSPDDSLEIFCFTAVLSLFDTGPLISQTTEHRAVRSISKVWSQVEQVKFAEVFHLSLL